MPVRPLLLAYTPPYDWEGVLAFLSTRRLKDVEHIEGGCYLRTVHLGARTGWIRVRHRRARRRLEVDHSPSLGPVRPELERRLRPLFDLDVDPAAVAAVLGRDPLLSQAVRRSPGLRIPGSFDAFELMVRAILGQQISVKAATTIGGRFAEAFGRRIRTPFPELSRLTPLASRVARSSVDEVARLGIVSARSRCLLAVAEAFRCRALRLEAGAPPGPAIEQLVALPGIGPWTAHYVAMRALRWADAFPKEDIVVRNNLGGVSPRQAEERSQAWRPWRAYAVLHVWHLPPERRPA
jgi:AraC family transcriptional regulator of adaptative response / DNA-3-methyladenine glycosylase II